MLITLNFIVKAPKNILRAVNFSLHIYKYVVGQKNKSFFVLSHLKMSFGELIECEFCHFKSEQRFSKQGQKRKKLFSSFFCSLIGDSIFKLSTYGARLCEHLLLINYKITNAESGSSK